VSRTALTFICWSVVDDDGTGDDVFDVPTLGFFEAPSATARGGRFVVIRRGTSRLLASGTATTPLLSSALRLVEDEDDVGTNDKDDDDGNNCDDDESDDPSAGTATVDDDDDDRTTSDDDEDNNNLRLQSALCLTACPPSRHARQPAVGISKLGFRPPALDDGTGPVAEVSTATGDDDGNKVDDDDDDDC
jgi:hypothetical protein